MQTRLFYEHLYSAVQFDEKDFPALLEYFTPFYLRKKHFLFQSGNVCKYVAFVMKGCLRYFQISEQGEEHIIYFAQEGWWAGGLYSFFNGTATSFNAQALEDCELLLSDKKSFESALASFPKFSEEYRRKTQRAYTAVQERIAEAQLLSAEERYNKLMKEQPSLLQRVPQHYIASFLGITPESLSRLRKKSRR
ncbi:MAG: Crp/Fnr family transcriptional regulator [Bacteroidota bacterium]|nr:Crp/Fnr family transcriptional regulator [Bacteroidota bacterium]